MKNRATVQFSGNMRKIFSYLLTTYGKISPSHLNDFEEEVAEMHYDPVTSVDNFFNRFEDLLEYSDIANFPYSHPEPISMAYNINKKTGKFRESIKSWKYFTPIQKTCIVLKKKMYGSHIGITHTRYLTLKQAGNRKVNFIEDIVKSVSSDQENMVNSAPPHQDKESPTATGNADILQQVLDQYQEMMRIISANSEETGRKNTNSPSTPSTGPSQGKPRHQMPAYFEDIS